MEHRGFSLAFFWKTSQFANGQTEDEPGGAALRSLSCEPAGGGSNGHESRAMGG